MTTDELRATLRSELAPIHTDIAALRTEMLAMEYRLTVRGGLMAAAVVAVWPA